jgi:hypothetical protein
VKRQSAAWTGADATHRSNGKTALATAPGLEILQSFISGAPSQSHRHAINMS